MTKLFENAVFLAKVCRFPRKDEIITGFRLSKTHDPIFAVTQEKETSILSAVSVQGKNSHAMKIFNRLVERA